MKKTFLIIAIIHIFLVLFFMVIFDYQHIPDSKKYLAVANEFASLKFQFSAGINCNTAPGYPIFLALIKPLTWNNMYLIGVIQSIIFVLSFWYFSKAIQLKYGVSNSAILILSVFVLANPENIYTNGTTLTESLAATLILFICGSLIHNLKTKFDKFIFVAGFSLLVLSKMEYLILLFALIPFLLFIKNYKIILVTSITLLCLFSINGLKNQTALGEFKMTSFGSGTVIYGGNNLNLDGSWHSAKTNNYIPEQYLSAFDSIAKLDVACACIKRDSLYKKMAIDAWNVSYTDQFKVIPVKFGKLWVLPGILDFYTGQKEIYKGLQLEKLFSDELWPWYGKWKHGAFLFVYWISLLLSFAGFYFKYKMHKLDRIDILILAILLFTTLIYIIPFYGIGRFHLPVISILFYYAVYFYNYLESKNVGFKF